MLVSHDVQLNSKSIIENSFGQLLCRHRERVCVRVCTRVFQTRALDVAASLPAGSLAAGGLCDGSPARPEVPLAHVVHPLLSSAKRRPDPAPCPAELICRGSPKPEKDKFAVK